MLEVAFSKAALKALEKIRNPSRARIVTAILAYAADPPARHDVTLLKGTDYMRLRVGAYRVIFRIIEGDKAEIMAVAFVGHRKQIYRRLK